MKVALVHDFLVEYGGGERVLEALHEIFPQAPIYTAYFDLKGFGPHKDRIKTWDIKTSWMQWFPRKFISPFRIFAPSIFQGFDLSGYDLVISSCNTYFAKAVKTKALHISYIHTPPRYLYGYATSFNYKKHLITRVLGELANHFLRLYDFTSSQKPDILVANSKEVQRRIKKFYRRDSVLVYPPVEFRIQNSEFIIKTKDYFISVNRLVRGKGTEVTVEMCTKLKILLKVVGGGPELERLKSLSGKSIEFLGEVSDEEKNNLLAGAKALIVASEDEDFGITAVEAQAVGTPVIAIKQGGYLETVIPGKTGIFFENPDELIQILKSFSTTKYRAENCIKNAQKFSIERFKKEVLTLVDKYRLIYPPYGKRKSKSSS